MRCRNRRPSGDPPRGRRAARGFTLVELIAVVLIITVFAALAVPTVVRQLRDRRIQESARQIALLFRQARLRAMGRGGAVLVRFISGRFEVHEAREGPAASSPACADLPVPSCTTTLWGNPATARMVDWHVESDVADGTGTAVTVANSAGTNQPSVDICFTPMGRAFVRDSNADTTAFDTLAEAYVATVSRPNYRSRKIVLMPNGTARLSTTP